jgi:hypothetical protein
VWDRRSQHRRRRQPPRSGAHGPSGLSQWRRPRPGWFYTALNPLPAKLANLGGNGLDVVATVVFIASFATVGALLAWKRPRNLIGWLLSGTGLAYAAGAFATLLPHFRQTLTLGNWLGWIWFVGLGLCVFVLLLFPTGHLPSRGWRPVAWAAGAGLAGWVLGNAFAPTIQSVSPQVLNPVGVSGPVGDIFKAMIGIGAGLVAARRARTNIL